MSCGKDPFAKRIDALDEELEALALGELPAERARELEAHARGCGECTAELDALRAERAMFARRTDERVPLEVWRGVEERIGGGGGLRGWLARQRQALIYGFLAASVAAAALAFFVAGARHPGPGELALSKMDAGAALAAPIITASQRVDNALDEADATQQEAVAQLEAGCQARRSHLNARDARRYDARFAKLQTMRKAIDEARATAGHDPTSRRRALLATARYSRALQNVLLEEVPR